MSTDNDVPSALIDVKDDIFQYVLDYTIERIERFYSLKSYVVIADIDNTYDDSIVKMNGRINHYQKKYDDMTVYGYNEMMNNMKKVRYDTLVIIDMTSKNESDAIKIMADCRMVEAPFIVVTQSKNIDIYPFSIRLVSDDKASNIVTIISDFRVKKVDFSENAVLKRKVISLQRELDEVRLEMYKNKKEIDEMRADIRDILDSLPSSSSSSTSDESNGSDSA
jgi:hypothetical protein